jgi:hypothetical protein
MPSQIFFGGGGLQYPDISVPLRKTIFLETTENHSEPDQGNNVGVPFQ